MKFWSKCRETIYVLQRRARLEGPAAVLEPRSRRPRISPARLPEAVRSQALEVRAALGRSGLDLAELGDDVEGVLPALF
ncbi:hypothetical protein [Actinomyces oris]|uniref:hypothetical protein n=1 Tax=Actinomyces oris TaxID=544580 RepID=UPI000A6F8709|nr:hypothetical protein [Actinomyces oris]